MNGDAGDADAASSRRARRSIDGAFIAITLALLVYALGFSIVVAGSFVSTYPIIPFFAPPFVLCALAAVAIGRAWRRYRASAIAVGVVSLLLLATTWYDWWIHQWNPNAQAKSSPIRWW